jgi:hypothetical protein
MYPHPTFFPFLSPSPSHFPSCSSHHYRIHTP